MPRRRIDGRRRRACRLVSRRRAHSFGTTDGGVCARSSASNSGGARARATRNARTQPRSRYGVCMRNRGPPRRSGHHPLEYSRRRTRLAVDASDPVTPKGVRIDPIALSWRFSRSSGPGGQHVNTTDSKAELICNLAQAGLPDALASRLIAKLGEEVRVVASSQRSQLRNRAEALVRLGDLIDAAAVVARTRRATRPGRGAVERRITAKKHTSARKADRRWRAED